MALQQTHPLQQNRFALGCLLAAALLTACSSGGDTDPPASSAAGGSAGGLAQGGGGFAGGAQGGMGGDGGAIPTPPPSFDQLDAVLDIASGEVNAWGHFVWVSFDGDEPSFHEVGYRDTADDADFWPASVIKIYTATAALMLLKQYDISLDAELTFYHQEDEAWVEDLTQSARDTIRGALHCSSNEDYTLLLRFAGLDWLGTSYFVPERGFSKTALMRPYVSYAPFSYIRAESQRIVMKDGGKQAERIHSWSETSYADAVGCTTYNGSGTANCTTPRDLTEHMRRIMFHEHLPPSEQLEVRVADLSWLRYGDGNQLVISDKNACGGPTWAGAQRVFPDADFFHKGGSVSDYRTTLDYLSDADSDTHYIVALAFDSGNAAPVERSGEELARMAKTPHQYVYLDYLQDDVNPITAKVFAYTEVATQLDLLIKDYETEPEPYDAYMPLPGATKALSPSMGWHDLASSCLDQSTTWHIIGQLSSSEYEDAYSAPHYVVVDAEVACP